jgi:hypothetical protein
VQFSAELRERVLAGDITVSFRLWRRPQVKVGGHYPVGSGQIHIDSINLMPFGAITKGDLRRTGEADKESLRQRAAHTGTIAAETLLYRIEFHPVRAGDLRRQRD